MPNPLDAEQSDGSNLATRLTSSPASIPYRATIKSRLRDAWIPSNAGWRTLLQLLRGLLAEVPL
jgi:hypothetical protein